MAAATNTMCWFAVTPPSSLCWWVGGEHRERPAHWPAHWPSLLDAELCGGQQEAGTNPKFDSDMSHSHKPSFPTSEAGIITPPPSSFCIGCFEEQGSAGVAQGHWNPQDWSVPNGSCVTECATWSSCHQAENTTAALAGRCVSTACAVGWERGSSGGSRRRRWKKV